MSVPLELNSIQESGKAVGADMVGVMGSKNVETEVGKIVFLDNLEAGKMGSHIRLIRFPYNSIVLKSIRILAPGEDPIPTGQTPGAALKDFDVRTFPKRVRPSSLAVFVRDRLKPECSTYTKLRQVQPYHFFTDRQVVTDEVIVKGEFVRLTVAMYGELIHEEDCPPTSDTFCPRDARRNVDVDLVPLESDIQVKILPQPYRLAASGRVSSLPQAFADPTASSGSDHGIDVSCLNDKGRSTLKVSLSQLLEEMRKNGQCVQKTFPTLERRIFEIAYGKEGYNCQLLAVEVLLAASEHVSGAETACQNLVELKRFLESNASSRRLAQATQRKLKTLIARLELFSLLCTAENSELNSESLAHLYDALRSHTSLKCAAWSDLLVSLPSEPEEWQRSLPEIPLWLHAYLTAKQTLKALCKAIPFFDQVRAIFVYLLPCAGSIELLAHLSPAELDRIVAVLTDINWRHVEELPEVPMTPDTWSPHELGVYLATFLATSTLVANLVDALDFDQLRALHRLAVGTNMSAHCVILAFRPEKCMQWLLGTLERRCSGINVDTSTRPMFADVRHMVAILHCIVIREESASLALRFGDSMLATTTLLMERIVTLPRLSEEEELQLQGGMQCAGHGRRRQDIVFDQQVKDLLFQLKPFTKSLKMSALLEVEKYSFHRVEDDMREGAVRGTSIVGGFLRGGTVNVWEVETSKDDDDQLGICKLPLYGWDHLPLLSWRILAAKTTWNAQFALEVFHQQHKEEEREPLPAFVCSMIRVCAALNSNLEQLALADPEHRGVVLPSSQHIARERHLLLLDSVLITLRQVLRSLHLVALDIFRQEKLLQVLLCVLTRLLQVDPVLRDLTPRCVSGVCQVLREWNSLFPKNARGQLWPQICRFGRVLPEHYATSMFVLNACGDLWPSLLNLPPNFHLSTGTERKWLKLMSSNAFEEDDDDRPDDFLGHGHAADSMRSALTLIHRVKGSAEHLHFADFQEFIGQCLMTSVTSNALLHVLAVRSLVLLTDVNVAVVKSIVHLGVEALRGYADTRKRTKEKGGIEDRTRLSTLGRLIWLLSRMAELSREVGRQILAEHEVADVFIARLLSMNTSGMHNFTGVIIRRTILMLTYIIERDPASVSMHRSVAKTLSTHILEKRDRADMACDALNLLTAMARDSKACQQLLYNQKGHVDPAFRLDKFATRSVKEDLAVKELSSLCSVIVRNVTDHKTLREIISANHLAELGPLSSKDPTPVSRVAPKTPLDVDAYVHEVFAEARALDQSEWSMFCILEPTKQANDDEWLFNRQLLRRKRREARDKLNDDIGERKRRRLGQKSDDKAKSQRDTFRRKPQLSRAPSKHVDSLGKTAVEDLTMSQAPLSMSQPVPFVPFGMPMFPNMLGNMMVPAMFPMPLGTLGPTPMPTMPKSQPLPPSSAMAGSNCDIPRE